jgi:hypothetical protein
MNFEELIEYLTSINNIMSKKTLQLLYSTLSEENKGKGIKYEDSQIIIIKRIKDSLKEE